MAEQRQRIVDPKRVAHRPRKADSILEEQAVLTEPSTPAMLERAVHRPRQMTPGDAQKLQRAFGNRAVTRLVAGAPAVQANRDPSAQIRTHDRGVLADGLIQVVQQVGAPGDRAIQTKVAIGGNSPAGLLNKGLRDEEGSVASGSRAGIVQPAVAPRLKPESGGQGNNVVQRQIQLDGVDASFGSLVKYAKDLNELVILANWSGSSIVHDFRTTGRGRSRKTARKKLKEALASAKSQVLDVPPLYSASNLKFLTKASGRLPTLYFKSGDDSGRIRQQHPSGPKVVRETNKIDYFFPDKARMKKFGAAAKKAKKKGKAFKPWLWWYKAKLTPTADYSHYEVTYKGNKKISKVHPSGGLVDLDISDYDDTKITSIYQRVIGSIT